MTGVTGRQASIIGAGLIGRSWAIIFAAAGWDVRITDTNESVLAALPGLIRHNLEELAQHGLVDDVDATAGRIVAVPDLAEAVAGSSFIQECGPETLAFKQEIFGTLDALVPKDTIIASSSSSIYPSLYTEFLSGRHRCLLGHPVNPPHLVPLVELCGAPWTSPDILARAREIYASIGQVPVTLGKEIEGFALNRLQGALLTEALRLVGEGVISAGDLDQTVKNGLGLRWSFMGPFETIELNAPGGIADYCARYGEFYRRISAAPAPPEVWDGPNLERVLKSWGTPPDPDTRRERGAWRDNQLAALRAYRRNQMQGE